MKKCIVLDLDNTLWGGVVGEDGAGGIKLSLEAPGSSFLAFQQALLDHYHRGVILALNSRNNPEDALEVIRTHPNMLLHEPHFAAMRINWNDKAQNIRELAEELNIGLDSMVFLDDDPTNRALVRSLVPEVEVPELPEDPTQYARFLNSLPYFPTEATTNEDVMRGNMYVTERLRMEAEKQHTSKEDFLRSLGLELTVCQDNTTSVARLAQLTEKTNQFNIQKQPFSEDEIRVYSESAEHAVWYGRLNDRFGEYGIVVFALVDKKGSEWHIRSLLMSCRVFGRGVEDAFLSVIVAEALAQGVRVLTIAFEESAKNAPAKEFVERYFVAEQLAVEPLQSPDWIELKIV